MSSIGDRELQLWQEWKRTNDPRKLKELLDSLKPVIHRRMNLYLGRVKAIPDAAIEAEFKKQAIIAIKSYDPARGVKLSTWVHNRLMKANRFVMTYQNVGRMPERVIEGIGAFDAVHARLTEELGRTPTDFELLAELRKEDPSRGWTLQMVQRMRTDRRADILSSTFEDDFMTWSPQLDDEVMAYLEEELDPEERKVWKFMRRYKGGLPRGAGNRIARQLGWSQAKVSRIRKRIEQRIAEYRSVFK